MSLPLPTNPAELSALRRRARRLVVTVSDLIRHGQHTCAAFQARVDADLPARDNGWDHFVDLCLRQVLAATPPPPPRTMRLTLRRSSQQARCCSGYTYSTGYSDIRKMTWTADMRSAGDSRQGRRRAGKGRRRRARDCSRCLHPRASCQCRSRRLGPITTTNTITSSTTS